MHEERRQTLIQREALLKLLMEWHTENRESIWDNPKDFEDFIDAALDELIDIQNELNEDKQKTLTKQATDLALLSQNMLKGEELTRFIKRSVELID